MFELVLKTLSKSTKFHKRNIEQVNARSCQYSSKVENPLKTARQGSNRKQGRHLQYQIGRYQITTTTKTSIYPIEHSRYTLELKLISSFQTR